jgi:hypothetical protein
MKLRIIISILSILLFVGCEPQNTSIEHLVGLGISSDNVQNFLDKLEAKPEITQSESWYTYDYKSKGIRLRFDKGNGNLLAIFLFSELTQDYRQYRGEMPYNLSFDDTRIEVEKKLGEPGSTEEGKPYINTTSQWFDKGLNVTYMTKDINDMMTKISFIVLHEVQ